MSETPDGSKRSIGGELVIPVAAIAFAIYFITTIWDSPWTAQVSAFLIGGTLIALCLIFIVKSVIQIRAGSAGLGLGGLLAYEDITSGRVWLLVATVGYCVLIDWGGFTLTTFFFLLIGMGILSRGQKLVTIFWAAAAMSLGGWALFIWAFDTRFPRGWFENTMRSLLGG